MVAILFIRIALQIELLQSCFSFYFHSSQMYICYYVSMFNMFESQAKRTDDLHFKHLYIVLYKIFMDAKEQSINAFLHQLTFFLVRFFICIFCFCLFFWTSTGFLAKRDDLNECKKTSKMNEFVEKDSSSILFDLES